jgi:uncharacterized protein
MPLARLDDADHTVPSLSGLSLQVTDACNLACSYCYFRDKEPITISPAVVTRAFELLERESAPGTAWHINLFGGEPTLFPGLIDQIAGDARRRASRQGRSLTFSMTTNGTRFDDEMLSIVKAYDISTLLSLDGNKKTHDAFRTYHNDKGSFDDIVKNLGRLRSAKGFSVRMTISVRSLPYLSESIRDLVELGIDSIATSVVAEDVWTEAEYDQFGDEWLKVAALLLHHRLRGKTLRIKDLSAGEGIERQCASTSDFGCGAATSFLFVDARGDLYPCHRYPGYFNKSPRVRLGSVFTGVDLQARSRYVAANRTAAKRGCGSFVHLTLASGTCRQCGIVSACGGACMAINENATGDPTSPPPVVGRIKRIMLTVQHEVDTYWQNLSTRRHPHERVQETI